MRNHRMYGTSTIGSISQPASIRSPTFLVVDDQPLTAEFMASVANDVGWTAAVACDAQEFTQSLADSHPDAIALDLAMPDRDGVELLRELSSAGYSGKLIIVSACDRPVVEASATLAGHRGLQVVGYAQKPVTAAAFAALLELARPQAQEMA